MLLILQLNSNYSFRHNRHNSTLFPQSTSTTIRMHSYHRELARELIQLHGYFQMQTLSLNQYPQFVIHHQSRIPLFKNILMHSTTSTTEAGSRKQASSPTPGFLRQIPCGNHNPSASLIKALQARYSPAHPQKRTFLPREKLSVRV